MRRIQDGAKFQLSVIRRLSTGMLGEPSMPTTDEWQAIARDVTDSLPPLSDEQLRALTLIARRGAFERLREEQDRQTRPMKSAR